MTKEQEIVVYDLRDEIALWKKPIQESCVRFVTKEELLEEYPLIVDDE